MSYPLGKITLIKEFILIAIYLWAYIIYCFFAYHDFSIEIPQKLYISQATLDGTDVGERVSFFYRALIISFLLFPLIYFAIHYLLLFLKLEKKLKAAVVISVTGFFLIVSDIIGLDANNSVHFFFFLLVITLIFTLLGKSGNNFFRLLSNNEFISVIFILSFLFYITLLIILGDNLLIHQNQNWIYFPIIIIIALIFLITKTTLRIFTRKLLTYLVPFALLPLFIFMAFELSILLKLKFSYSFNSKLILIFLITSSFIINLFVKRSYHSNKYLTKYFAPGAILCFLLLNYYLPTQNQPIEIFELANSANAIMRIYDSGEIPFVDFMSSHMFSDQFYGIIYSSIFGYDGKLDFITYQFFFIIIFYIIAWGFVLKIIGNPTLALLFLITFPFLYMLFYPPIFFGIIAYYSIIGLVNTQTIKNYLSFLLVITLLILWRLDTGSASFFTSLVFLPALFYIKGEKIKYLTALKAMSWFLLLVILLVSVACIIRTPVYILENFKSAFHYITANQAHGYSSITANFNHQFYVYHVMVPAIGIFSIYTIIYILKSGKYSKIANAEFILSSSLFLFILFLANFQRGLVRHSFWEGTEHFLVSLFFSALTLFIFYFIKKKYNVNNYILLLGISFTVILFLKYFPIEEGKTRFEKIFTENLLNSSINYFKAHNSRIITNEKFANENYTDIRQFLDHNLTKEQTFLDFSNSPMLYFYTQRKIPSYFCQSLQNTVDDYLQLQHLKRVTPEKVPVAIYSNYPPQGFDALDGVPNAMRHYLIAEYIYNNYRPFCVINNRSIWLAKNFEAEWEKLKTDELINNPVSYDYKQGASAINRYYEGQNYKDLEVLNEIEVDQNQQSNQQIKLALPELKNDFGIYCKLILNNTLENQQIKMVLLHENEEIGRCLFSTSADNSGYMVRLSNHYLWHKKLANSIVIEKPDNISIQKIEFYKDNR